VSEIQMARIRNYSIQSIKNKQRQARSLFIPESENRVYRLVDRFGAGAQRACVNRPSRSASLAEGEALLFEARRPVKPR
jgi:hypothetical protein